MLAGSRKKRERALCLSGTFWDPIARLALLLALGIGAEGKGQPFDLGLPLTTV